MEFQELDPLGKWVLAAGHSRESFFVVEAEIEDKSFCGDKCSTLDNCATITVLTLFLNNKYMYLTCEATGIYVWVPEWIGGQGKPDNQE